MSILFINGSPNPRGNTARLAAQLLAGMRWGGMVTTAAEAKRASAQV